MVTYYSIKIEMQVRFQLYINTILHSLPTKRTQKKGSVLLSISWSPKCVAVTGDGSNIQCCKEQYCIGTWNVKSMNQGKLEVIKQEMARVNVDILGISELNGLEWVNLTQMTIIYTTVGRNPLEEME